MISTIGSAPYWVLSLAYWLHMLATVAWIGGLVALIYLFLPAAQKNLEPDAYTRMLVHIQRRLDPLAWLSLAVLVATGLIQMSASPNYRGFLQISNPWSAAILVKHLAFALMVALSAYISWAVLPALRRLALLKSRGSVDIARLQRREQFLLRLNLILGVIILGLTALARAV